MSIVHIGLFVAALVLAEASTAKQPHVVILMVDDMGWNDIGFHGSEIPTPNLDALAYSGIVLTRHYAQPSCTPSRAAFFTGQYPIRYGQKGLQGKPVAVRFKGGLPLGITIMPEVLKNLGYRTHLVGKWHQGYSTRAHMPTRRGFDSFFGYLNGYLSYYDGIHFDDPLVGLDFRWNEEENWPAAYAKYLPELLSEKGEDVIRQHSREHKDEPLFLLLSANAPHAGGNRPFAQDLPPSRLNNTDFITDPGRRNLADVMRYVDNTLGTLTTALKSEGMLEDTLILFMSDNGGATEDPIWGYQNHASNFSLRGSKMSMFEGGVKVPTILWKAGLNATGQIYDKLFHISDWLPTLNRAAGGEAIEGLDGVDQWETLNGAKEEAPRNELLVEVYPESQSWGYVENNFKLVKSYNPKDQLAFTDEYISSAPQVSPQGYEFETVQNSAVAKALGLDLNESECLAKRKQLQVVSTCADTDQQKAMAHDCSTAGCLFDVIADPIECFDISSQYPLVKTRLASKIKSLMDVMVPRKVLPSDNHRNSRNYFGPSSVASGTEWALLLHAAALFLVMLLQW